MMLAEFALIIPKLYQKFPYYFQIMLDVLIHLLCSKWCEHYHSSLAKCLQNVNFLYLTIFKLVIQYRQIKGYSFVVLLIWRFIPKLSTRPIKTLAKFSFSTEVWQGDNSALRMRNPAETKRTVFEPFIYVLACASREVVAFKIWQWQSALFFCCEIPRWIKSFSVFFRSSWIPFV